MFLKVWFESMWIDMELLCDDLVEEAEEGESDFELDVSIGR